jgi:K+-transporting ATPase ATPase C chain
MWRAHLRTALVLYLLLSVLTGVIYPLGVTFVAQVAMARQANGSLLIRDGRPVGSALIGQPFSAPRYFWSRPSATLPDPYDGGASAGANLGPTNPRLIDGVKARVAALRAADPGNTAPVPVDLVTTSASGLDPHISPAAADYQAARVARARSLDVAVVRRLVAEHTEPRAFGLLGEPRVRVLELNLALDAWSGDAAHAAGAPAASSR